MEERRFAALSDIVPLAVIAAAALLLWAVMSNSGGGKTAELVADNTVIKRLDLSKDCTYKPEGYDVEITVKDGKAAFTSADCPDKICIKTGFIGTRGQSAVCLPNRLTLRITGGSDGVDAAIG